MDSTNIWNKFDILCYKIIGLVLLCFIGYSTKAQFHKTDHDAKKIYFGIMSGYNQTNFRVEHSTDFLQHDSILTVVSPKSPGFNLGVVMNYRINKYFDIRTTPGIAFSVRQLEYTEIASNSRKIEIESVLVQEPIWIKFKSVRYKDIRFYVLAGMRLDYDLASNSKKRKAVDIVKLKPVDISADYGIGVQIYFPMFILVPEITISQGIPNLHTPTPELQYSNVIDKLFTRTITFKLQFEG